MQKKEAQRTMFPLASKKRTGRLFASCRLEFWTKLVANGVQTKNLDVLDICYGLKNVCLSVNGYPGRRYLIEA